MIEHDLKPIRRAMAKISFDSLHRILGLPKDVKVVGCVQNTEDLLYGRFAVVLEGPVIPFKHKPGEVLPEIDLRYRNEVRTVFDGFN